MLHRTLRVIRDKKTMPVDIVVGKENIFMGFMAVGLFSTGPVELYKLTISPQSSLTAYVFRSPRVC